MSSGQRYHRVTTCVVSIRFIDGLGMSPSFPLAAPPAPPPSAPLPPPLLLPLLPLLSGSPFSAAVVNASNGSVGSGKDWVHILAGSTTRARPKSQILSWQSVVTKMLAYKQHQQQRQ
jgi:hypothetical protein